VFSISSTERSTRRLSALTGMGKTIVSNGGSRTKLEIDRLRLNHDERSSEILSKSDGFGRFALTFDSGTFLLNARPTKNGFPKKKK